MAQPAVLPRGVWVLGPGQRLQAVPHLAGAQWVLLARQPQHSLLAAGAQRVLPARQPQHGLLAAGAQQVPLLPPPTLGWTQNGPRLVRRRRWPAPLGTWAGATSGV